jgi:hypothetical protein
MFLKMFNHTFTRSAVCAYGLVVAAPNSAHTWRNLPLRGSRIARKSQAGPPTASHAPSAEEPINASLHGSIELLGAAGSRGSHEVLDCPDDFSGPFHLWIMTGALDKHQFRVR